MNTKNVFGKNTYLSVFFYAHICSFIQAHLNFKLCLFIERKYNNELHSLLRLTISTLLIILLI